jgi:hypothetical protein
MTEYLKNIFLACNYFVNALLRGQPNETLSSRAYRMQQKPQPYWHGLAACINCIFWWQNNHCRGAYAGDRARLLVPLPSAVLKSEVLQ